MTWSLLGSLHVSLAIAGLGSGLVVALLRKGTTWHRRAGWVYVASMVGVNVSALLIYRLLGTFGPFHGAALFSLITIAAGMIPVRRRADRGWLFRHAYWMAGSYVGLWAAAVAETTTRARLVPFWWMVVLSTVVVLVIGAAIIARTVPGAIERMGRRRPAA
ncbi:MAG: DUF2306 domain-containing protein [Vicinamibacterales bacterium]